MFSLHDPDPLPEPPTDALSDPPAPPIADSAADAVTPPAAPVRPAAWGERPPEAPETAPIVRPPTAPAERPEVSDTPVESQRLGRKAVQRLSSFLVSLVTHMVLLLVLSLLVTLAMPQRRAPVRLVIFSPENKEPAKLERLPTPVQMEAPRAQLDPLITRQATTPNAPQVEAPVPAITPAPTAAPTTQPQAADLRALLQPTHLPTGGGFEGRAQAAKARLLADRGGTAASERAVAMGLGWIAAHQRDDGSWHFDHRRGPCQGLCANPGNVPSTTGATALALLPFLGAGHTHRTGEHREIVRRGLYYLSSRMVIDRRGGDLQEGTMYAQGLAAIAFCEAYAMSGDKELKPAAQRAIDFICSAQHKAGGWRYFPGQPGDATVTGWQLMALKSARIGKLRVPSPVIEQARAFLDSLQTSGGAQYGYMSRAKEPTPTAVGLLCRMYLGWPQDDPRLQRGVDSLLAIGPSKTDMYFNYYATQVLHHHDGPGWKGWNRRLRDYLIATQSLAGHQRGSWHFKDRHGDAGGRLYNTAICSMILEVYYRHMPLYGAGALEEEF